MFLADDWVKSEQPPQSHVAEGLQASVLRLSTAGCTAGVGKSAIHRAVVHRMISKAWVRAGRSALQEDAPATQVGQLALQGGDLAFAQGQLQFYAVGRELLLDQQPAEFGDS